MTKNPTSAKLQSIAEMGADLILASASPRRQELLSRLEIPFKVIPSSVVEDYGNGMSPEEMAEHYAVEKARDVAAQHPDKIVIGADTIVVLDGKIMGKPRDAAEAKSMLNHLSAKTHTVLTGVALVQVSSAAEASFVESTDVTFFTLTDDMIDRYVATGGPLDKAGAYGIQDWSACFVEKVNGCYHNVMGFPSGRFAQVLSSEAFRAQFSVDNWFVSEKEIV